MYEETGIYRGSGLRLQIENIGRNTLNKEKIWGLKNKEQRIKVHKMNNKKKLNNNNDLK